MSQGADRTPPSCTCDWPVLDVDCPIHGREVAAIAIEAIDQGRAISAQPEGRCELCGAVEETRPYGPNGEEVCFSCGMKDEGAAKQAFDRRSIWKSAGTPSEDTE